MHRLVLILSAFVAIHAGAARAAFVGVTFDEASYCDSAIVPPLTVARAYLVFSYLATPTVSTWEINLSCSNVTLIGLQARTEGITISPWPGDYMCSLTHPQPIIGDRYVAADLLVMSASGWTRGQILGDGVHFHLLPEKVPCYTDDHGNAYELECGRDFNVLAVVNGEHPCVVGEELSSFGSIKSLFR